MSYPMVSQYCNAHRAPRGCPGSNAEHEPELAQEIRETICEGTQEDTLRNVLDDIRELREDVNETGKA